MFLKIDPDRSLPIFMQIIEGVRLAVATGRVRPGERIPSIRDLAVEIRVNPNTVARAYLELDRAGVIETKRGLGYFVSAETNGSLAEHERQEILEDRVKDLLRAATDLGFKPEEVKAVIDRKFKKPVTDPDKPIRKDDGG
jgi:GntR family transcriptional regulator